MDVNLILQTFNAHCVDYLLIGGMNFLLFHEPVLTFDVDLWIDDAPENLRCAEQALGELRAEWARTEQDWRPVAEMASGWLSRQSVFCLTSPHGSIDVFRGCAGSNPGRQATAARGPARPRWGPRILGYPTPTCCSAN